MSKSEVLDLLLKVLYRTGIGRTAPDDPSGISTVYVVDHEQLVKNIETELEKENA